MNQSTVAHIKYTRHIKTRLYNTFDGKSYANFNTRVFSWNL